MCQKLLGVFLVLGLHSVAIAAEREQREFVIYVNGKEAGQSTMVINQQDDGLTHVSAHVNVKFQQLVLTYNFAVESAEWWRDGKLVGLKCQASENGKKTDAVLSAENGQLRGRVNSQERMFPAEVWTSSFWKLPDAKYHNKTLPVFEADTGKEYQGQLQYVATEQLTFMNRAQSCYRFRVTGGATTTDLWFDQHHRLVRQEFVELGHKTIVQLTNIRR